MDIIRFLLPINQKTKPYLPLILLLIFVFFYKTLIILNSYLTFFSDDAIYSSIARFWINQRFNLVFHPTWPPLYPFLSAITYLFLRNWEISLRVVSAISVTLLIIPFYFLLNKHFAKATTLVVLFIFSFYQPLFFISIFTLSDSLAIFLIILSITYFYFGLIETKLAYFLTSSFLFGLVFLTRSEGTLFFGLSLLFLFFYLVIKIFIEKKVSTKKIAIIPLFIVVFLLTTSPYLIATKAQLGIWTFSAKFSAQIQQGHAFALNNQTTWSQEVVSIKSANYKSEFFKNGTEYLLENLVEYTRWFDQKLQSWQTLFLNFFPMWSIIFIFIGTLTLLRNQSFWSICYFIFLLIFAIPVTIFTTPITDIRYLAWTIPLFIFFFLLGIKNVLILTRFLTSRFFGFFLLIFFIITLLELPLINIEVVLNPIMYADTITAYHYKPELKEVALFIKTSSKNPEPKIMMRREMVEFYSDGETIYMPQAPLEKVLEYAQKNRVDYIVAWDNELEKDENLKILLDEKLNYPLLKKVFELKNKKTKIVVYALN